MQMFNSRHEGLQSTAAAQACPRSKPLPEHIVAKFEQYILEHGVGANTVVALTGVGSLFGLLKVNQVVARLAPLTAGRLLVFFPGSYREDNSYRLFDAYDGWDYLAVPITADNSK